MTSRLGPPRCFVRTPAYVAARRRLVVRMAKRRYDKRHGIKRKPRLRKLRVLTFTGETRTERCYREAVEVARCRVGRTFGVAALETNLHDDYLRFRRAVQEEYVARLKAAGVPVEGAE